MFVAFALATAAPMAILPPTAHAQGVRVKLHDRAVVSKVRLTLDKSLTVRLDKNVTEALVANQEIADVVPLTGQSIYIVGKKIGLTRLTLLDEQKDLLGIIEIEVSYDVDALKLELARNVPGADFNIRTANGRLILSGTVADAMALAKVSDIVKQFAPDHFLNAMNVRAPQQVMLEVRFVEAQRSAGRDLGLSWDGGSNRFRGITGGVSGSSTIGPTVDPNKANDFGQPTLVTPGIIGAGALLTGLPSGALPFGTFLAKVLDKGFAADAVIQALETRGVARRLAEPNLVTLSGDTANFLAGGEFPIPVTQGEGDKISIEFKKFGVGLAFTPTVLGGGQINLKIEPEVSDLDFSNAIRLSSTIIPSVVVRRAQTTVELRDGQSFAIAGLIQTRHNKNVAELPWIGQVPVLGALFSSSSYAKQESDLVIIVTPRLVRPAIPGQKLLTPHDKVVAANDKDFFLRGKMEIERPAKPYGHILPERGSWKTQSVKGDDHGAYK
jgi:pilus assembly protein CpaC